MAQLVIAAAGAAVGFAVGGPVGAQFGWAIGSVVGAQFGPKQKSYGPRLEDLRVTGSEYGQAIPWAAGHPRIAGQVWWASQRREISTTTSQGKGGGGAEYTTYTYEVDLLIGLTSNQIPGVSRIWSNGKLVYCALAGAPPETAAVSLANPLWSRLTVYTGESTQLPDPTYEAAVANAPAYRGRGSVFIEGLQLGNSGVIPNLTFEISPGSLDAFELIGTAEVAGITSLPQLPDHEAGDLLVLFSKHVGGLTPTAITDCETPTGGIWGTSPKFRLQWKLLADAGPEVLPGSVNEVMLAAIFRGAEIVGSVSSASALASSLSAPIISTQTPGGGYVLDYGSVNNGTLSWSGSGDIVINQDNALGGGDTILTYTGELVATSSGTLFSRVPVASALMDTASVELAPVAAGTGVLRTETLQDVVQALCENAGMPAGTYDATALASITKPVRSFVLSQVATTRSAIEQLMAAYFFEAYVTDKIYFVPRGGSVADSIDADDMGAGLESPEDETLPTRIGNELEISAQVDVSYSNVDADYTTATEHSDRLV